MRNKRKIGVSLVFVVGLLLPAIEAPFAASGTEKLDSFFSAEFKEFNQGYEKYIQQLDKCLDEMDRFEKGDVFLDPIECRKFQKMRPEADSMVKEHKIVSRSYYKWLPTLSDNAVEKLSAPDASEMATASLAIYSIQFKKVVLQTKRVRKKEDELEGKMMKLLEDLEKIR